jgi:hypothetical protein
MACTKRTFACPLEEQAVNRLKAARAKPRDRAWIHRGILNSLNGDGVVSKKEF